MEQINDRLIKVEVQLQNTVKNIETQIESINKNLSKLSNIEVQIVGNNNEIVHIQKDIAKMMRLTQEINDIKIDLGVVKDHINTHKKQQYVIFSSIFGLFLHLVYNLLKGGS